LLTDEVNLLKLRRVLKDRFQASVEIAQTIEVEQVDISAASLGVKAAGRTSPKRVEPNPEDQEPL